MQITSRGQNKHNLQSDWAVKKSKIWNDKDPVPMNIFCSIRKVRWKKREYIYCFAEIQMGYIALIVQKHSLCSLPLSNSE